MNVKEMSLPMPKNGKPMTNEEWFCQLSTEEKAKALGKVAYTVMTYNEALRWLKEIHE